VDEQQQQRVNRAAEEYANAGVEAQRAMAERGVSAQEMNAQLNQQFFNGVIDNLQRMAAETRGLPKNWPSKPRGPSKPPKRSLRRRPAPTWST
jgi:Zn-dependent oligopeptidase